MDLYIIVLKLGLITAAFGPLPKSVDMPECNRRATEFAQAFNAAAINVGENPFDYDVSCELYSARPAIDPSFGPAEQLKR